LSKFRRKYGVGRKGKGEDKWLLGCYCRETKQCRIVQVKNRKRSTIMPLLLKFMDSGSVVLTDFAKIYVGIGATTLWDPRDASPNF
jgi:transposase-like protein